MVKRAYIALSLLCIGALAVLLICRQLAETRPAADSAVKTQAVALAATARSILSNRLPGPEYSLITTTLGSEEAKHLSLQPDFAAVAVDLLIRAGVRPGDRVALNVTGSFPGLNIAVLAALQALGADPVLISSVGASTWGATNPLDTWLDMEHSLTQAGLWPWRSSAASPGGVGDRGGGLDKEGLTLIHAAMGRNGVPELGSTNVTNGVSRRLALFRDPVGNLPTALINVGGSHVIFGSRGHAAPLRQGLTTGYRQIPVAADSLATPFLTANRPVIHFINVRRLAAHFQITTDSAPGSASVFRERHLAPALRGFAATSLVAIVSLLWWGRRSGWWQIQHRPSTTN